MNTLCSRTSKGDFFHISGHPAAAPWPFKRLINGVHASASCGGEYCASTIKQQPLLRIQATPHLASLQSNTLHFGCCQMPSQARRHFCQAISAAAASDTPVFCGRWSSVSPLRRRHRQECHSSSTSRIAMTSAWSGPSIAVWMASARCSSGRPPASLPCFQERD